jgi:hypothetical protein
MPRITLYVVQTFVDSGDGLVAEEPFQVENRSNATVIATLLAPKKEGVVAWAKSGDPDTGEWDDDLEILFKAGRTGD